MRSAALISNPSASQFTGGVFRQVSTTLSNSFDVTTEWPINPLETAEISAQAAADGIDVVFAMGGDGVAHHVANALVNTETALGIIPVGTTNVLARILGIPLDPVTAAADAGTWNPTPTRLISVVAHTATGQKTRYATFSFGVGFDADVVSLADSRPYAKVRFGGVHYARTAVGHLLSTWRTQMPNLRISCNGERFDGVLTLTQVHGPYTYFGRIPLRLTQIDVDGIATLAANNLAVKRATEIFARAALGRRHREATGIRVWRDHDLLTIEAEPAAAFHADGELLGMAEYLEIRPVHDALRVLRPDTLQVEGLQVDRE